MNTVKIVNVTDHNGKVIPKRIGRIVAPAKDDDELNILTRDGRQVFYYKDEVGAFVTSPVKSIVSKGNGVIIMETQNSIYTLEEVDDGETKGEQE